MITQGAIMVFYVGLFGFSRVTFSPPCGNFSLTIFKKSSARLISQHKMLGNAGYKF